MTNRITTGKWKHAPDYFDRVRERDAVVYRAWDEDDNLLYVGCTVDFKARMGGHHSYPQSAWWPYATRIEQSGPWAFDDARARESHAIETESPWFNGTPKHMVQVQRWRGEFHHEYKRLTGDRCYSYDAPNGVAGTDTPFHPVAFWLARRKADEVHGPCQDALWRHGCYLAHVELQAVAA